jgi:uncharacterized membrane protein
MADRTKARRDEPTGVCAVCGKTFPRSQLAGPEACRAGVQKLIAADHPEWNPASLICHDDLARYRRAYIEDLLEEERGELSRLDRDVLESLATHSIVATDPGRDIERAATFGERMADAVARFGGSWLFILSFLGFLVLWMALNVLRVLGFGFDPYPFILLNLMLSCIAAIQAPIIMMSQHRQEVKDRLRAENDYRVNLKAELEIRLLHEKIDHQMAHQWEKLAELQRMQIEALEEQRKP